MSMAEREEPTASRPHVPEYGIPESEAGFLTLLACTVLFFATFALCRTAEDCRPIRGWNFTRPSRLLLTARSLSPASRV